MQETSLSPCCLNGKKSYLRLVVVLLQVTFLKKCIMFYYITQICERFAVCYLFFKMNKITFNRSEARCSRSVPIKLNIRRFFFYAKHSNMYFNRPTSSNSVQNVGPSIRWVSSFSTVKCSRLGFDFFPWAAPMSSGPD